MGNNNVTTTTVETLAINSNDIDNKNLHNVSHIKINDVDYNDDYNNYTEKQKEEVLVSSGNEVHSNARLNGKLFHRSSISQTPQSLNTVQEISDETDENSQSQSKAPLLSSPLFDKETSSLLITSVDYDSDYKDTQNDADSQLSDSKLMINDINSDTDEIIQELNKLISETNEHDFHKNGFYRKRGQSWSNWDTSGSGELKAESSLSTFSRPSSSNGKELIKQKTLQTMESRERPDTIEWLAKQNGIELGNTLEFNEQLFTKSSKNLIENGLNTSPDLLTKNNEVKYDEEDEQLINLIHKEFIK